MISAVVRRARERLDNDPVFRFRHNIRGRIAGALRRTGKAGSAIGLLGCSPEDARRFIEDQFTEGMNWLNWGDWHVDHRAPLAAFDLSDPEQLAKACHYTNLQPLWALDNMSKGARIDA